MSIQDLYIQAMNTVELQPLVFVKCSMLIENQSSLCLAISFIGVPLIRAHPQVQEQNVKENKIKITDIM